MIALGRHAFAVALVAAALVAAPARAQDLGAGVGDPSTSSEVTEGDGESDAAADDAAEREEADARTAGTAPAIVDARLAEVDDGIDEIFSAWASERFFSGAVPLGSSSMLLTELGARFGITRDSRARIDWGFAYTYSLLHGSFMDTTTSSMSYDARIDRVEARNPVLSFEWAPRIDSTRLSFGLGVAIPTAAGEPTPSTIYQAAAYDASYLSHELMLATAGGLGPWRYRAERLGLFIPISFTFPIDRMTIALEGAAAISAPVLGAPRRPITGDLQADVQISGDVVPEVRLGARFGISLLDIGANTAPGTIVQPSATGYVRLRLDPGFVVASILADLGGYYGLTASGGVWSVTLGGGAVLP